MEAEAGARAGVEAGAGVGAGAGAGAGTRVQASKTALRIHCKSFSEYLGILVAAAEALARDFVPEGLAGWSDNLSPDSKGEEESKRAIEGAAERHSRRGRPRPQTEVILDLISSKTLFQMDWLIRWVWRY